MRKYEGICYEQDENDPPTLAPGAGMFTRWADPLDVQQAHLEGNITAVTGKTVNLLPVPIFALFFFALFVPFARTIGVWVGAVLGALAGAAIAFSGPLVYFLYSRFGIDPAIFNSELISQVDAATGERWMTAEDPISFQWIGVAAFIVSISSGTLVSWLLSKWDKNGVAK